MARVSQGDTRAFDALTRKHLARAYAIARRVLMNTADAEEAASDAFSKVWVHAADWQPQKAKFTTWFYRIVTNAALDMARKRKLDTTSDETVLLMQADTSPNIETVLQVEDEQRAVRDAIASLTAAQRAAVSLTYFEEMTNPEAASAMGIHVKALEGLLVRARKTLRTVLGDTKGGKRYAA
jgi:RNA polymerase sigma-70 factor (ECF subfamily)